VTEGHTHYNGRQFYIVLRLKYRSNEQTDPERIKLAKIPEVDDQEVGNAKIRKKVSLNRAEMSTSRRLAENLCVNQAADRELPEKAS
jgi:hypothetical protein